MLKLNREVARSGTELQVRESRFRTIKQNDVETAKYDFERCISEMSVLYEQKVGQLEYSELKPKRDEARTGSARRRPPMVERSDSAGLQVLEVCRQQRPVPLSMHRFDCTVLNGALAGARISVTLMKSKARLTMRIPIASESSGLLSNYQLTYDDENAELIIENET